MLLRSASWCQHLKFRTFFCHSSWSWFMINHHLMKHLRPLHNVLKWSFHLKLFGLRSFIQTIEVSSRWHISLTECPIPFWEYFSPSRVTRIPTTRRRIYLVNPNVAQQMRECKENLRKYPMSHMTKTFLGYIV